MLSSTIRHGDLVIDVREDMAIQIVRQSNMQTIVLSSSEFAYIIKVCEIFDFMIAAPGDMQVISH